MLLARNASTNAHARPSANQRAPERQRERPPERERAPERDPSALTYSYIGMYGSTMARAATTTDVFNAIAEPRRRELLDELADGERSVNELVQRLGLPQPLVSKHLRVLREVGAVRVRDDGRRRLYSVDAGALKPLHDWVSNYERMWSERFDALDTVLDELKVKEQNDAGND